MNIRQMIKTAVGVHPFAGSERELANLFEFARRHHFTARLAHTMKDSNETIPYPVLDDLFKDALIREKFEKRTLRYEINRVERAFFTSHIQPVLLKGGAYLITNHSAAVGRRSSDLDILVKEQDLNETENRVIEAGWQFEEKTDNPRDQHYYRNEMHELPPLRHLKRKTVLDVHFRLVPKTARYQLDTHQMFLASRLVEGTRVRVLSRLDMFCHAATHAFMDGEFNTPVRSLIEIYDLYCDLTVEEKGQLMKRAEAVGAKRGVQIGLWLLGEYFSITPMHGSPGFLMKLLFKSAVESRKATPGFVRIWFILRGHWLRAPAHLTARHLLVKTFSFKAKEEA